MNVLGRLALRALGAPAQVRPRLGGLFESPAAGGGTEVVATPAFAAQIERPAASPFRASIVQAAALPQAPSEPPPAPGLGRPPGFGRPPLAGEADRRSPEAHPRFDASADAPSPSSGATPAPMSLVVEEPAEIRAFADARRPESRESPAAPPEPYRPLLPPLPPLPVRRADTPSLAQRGEPAGQGLADLHVSIGRIEVRGEAERRTPAPAPRPGPRLMSLEDYLAKGRRR